VSEPQTVATPIAPPAAAPDQASHRPIARSPIAPAPPIVVRDGWEVSGRPATADLVLIDCTPLAKFAVRAPISGRAAAELGVSFGRAARADDGVLVVGSGPGEWMLIGPPDHRTAIASRLEAIAALAPDELVTFVDQTHGRALIRVKGSSAAAVLAKQCGIDWSDDITPDGAALRSSVAAVATDIIRDDQDGVRSYLLHCERSSGQYLFDALLDAGVEFSMKVGGFSAPGI
jgi:heterotetrameric sarcosine oxidase gamma subunit